MKPAFSQRIISGVLAIWLSGVALLFCCGNMEARAAETEKDFCPLAKTSHCNKQSGNDEINTDFARFQKEDSTLDCCAFLPKVFDKVRNIEKIPQVAAAPVTAQIFAPKFSFVVAAVKSIEIYQPVVRNRGSTYLQNCVFRI